MKMYVRRKLYLYEEVAGGGLRMVLAGVEMKGYTGKTLYISEAVSLELREESWRELLRC